MTAVAQAFDTTEREIIVTERTKVRAGRSQNGRGWVLDDIRATELDGTPIAVILRTFDRLEPGDTVRVSFEPFMQDGVGVSHYTLKRVRGADEIRASRNQARAAVMGQAPPANDPSLEARLAGIELRIGEITNELGALTARFTLLASLLEKDA